MKCAYYTVVETRVFTEHGQESQGCDWSLAYILYVELQLQHCGHCLKDFHQTWWTFLVKTHSENYGSLNPKYEVVAICRLSFFCYWHFAVGYVSAAVLTSDSAVEYNTLTKLWQAVQSYFNFCIFLWFCLHLKLASQNETHTSLFTYITRWGSYTRELFQKSLSSAFSPEL